MTDFTTPAAVTWRITIVIMPIVAVATFIWSWIKSKRASRTGWPSRILLITALAVFVTTLLRIAAAMHFYWISMATQRMSDVEYRMALLSVADECTVFCIGLLLSAFCLVLAFITPLKKKEE